MSLNKVLLTPINEDQNYLSVADSQLRLTATQKLKLILKFSGLKKITYKNCQMKRKTFNYAKTNLVKEKILGNTNKSYVYKLLVKPSKISVFRNASLLEEKMVYNYLIKPTSDPALLNQIKIILNAEALALLKHIRSNFNNLEFNKNALTHFKSKTFDFLIKSKVIKWVRHSHYILSEYHDYYLAHHQAKDYSFSQIYKESKKDEYLNCHDLQLDTDQFIVHQKLIDAGYEPEPTNNRPIKLKLHKGNKYTDIPISITVYNGDTTTDYKGDTVIINPSLSNNPIYQNNTERLHQILEGVTKYMNDITNSDYKYDSRRYILSRHDLALDMMVPDQHDGELRNIEGLPKKVIYYNKHYYRKENLTRGRLEYRNLTGWKHHYQLDEFIEYFKSMKFDFLVNICQQQHL